MKFFILAAVFLLLPSVLAIDCDLTSDPTYCETIKASSQEEAEKDDIFSSLLYSDSEFPNHDFIKDYNLGISVDSPPENTRIYNSDQIRNAWISFLAVFPSVYEDNILYVPNRIKALSEYSYEVYVPSNYKSSRYPKTSKGDCKRTYRLVDENIELKYYLNGIYRGQGKTANLYISSDGKLKSELKINTKLRVRHYEWDRYCKDREDGRCVRYGYKCRYDYTSYEYDSLTISEEKEIRLYTKKPSAEATITDSYLDTIKGIISAEDFSLFKLSFQDSYYIKQNYFYDLVFDKKPFYIAYLEAHNFSNTKQSNINVVENTFFVKNTIDCNLLAYNHFYTFSSLCNLDVNEEEMEELSKEEKDINLSLLYYILVFLLIVYIIYRILKSQWKKLGFTFLFILLIVPSFALAAEEECGITNLASCIPEKLYDYFLYVINAPLLPMLIAIKELAIADVSIDIFYHLWSIMRYLLSFFYVFFFLYAGYIFLTSSSNPIRRSYAKEMLKNTLIMMVLIQGSFYFYGIALDLSSIMDNAILSMIDPHFFLLSMDNFTNVGLGFLFPIVYMITLFFTMLLLALRYIIVSFGVVLLPLGLFCYFIPPLKGYGRFIINMLAIFIFVTFFDLLIILGCSMLIDVPVFENFKILVMISCFMIVNYTLWLAIKFAMKRSTNVSLRDDINQAAKYIALIV